jgi:hypothetical protein
MLRQRLLDTALIAFSLAAIFIASWLELNGRP